MRIKVFSAPQLHEALAKVRQEMGPEALILDRQQSRDAQGSCLWHVHAALDNAPELKASETQAQSRVNTNDTAMKHLERIVKGLGNMESASLRGSLANSREQQAFDHLMRLGISACHAFDMAADFADVQPAGSKIIRWAKQIHPQTAHHSLLFSGPSGSGKTILVAKLAAHYSLKGIRVALVSTDTERIGGTDTLKAYASTLGIPFFPLRHKKDAGNIRQQTQTAQLLLIDTEGWSPRRDNCLKRQTCLWKAMDCTRRFIVIPANMDEEDGMQQLAHKQTAGMTDIAFTKLDETQRPGKIVNWSIATGLPMSYCSFGPEVPEQMGWLTAQTLTTLLSKHDRKNAS